jgi:hypothetical protein
MTVVDKGRRALKPCRMLEREAFFERVESRFWASQASPAGTWPFPQKMHMTGET